MNLTPKQFELFANVMYEPLSYIHSSYPTLASKDDSLIWQKIANHELIKQYKLLPELDYSTDDIVEKIVSSWHILPRCALFLGYFYSRNSLLLSENYYRLDKSLQAFLSLYPIVNINKDDDNQLQGIPALTIGYHLLFHFISSISTALSQRFILLFDVEISQITLPDSIGLSRSLFLLVLNYAALTA
ncbi:type III secretion protein [Proteus hauseri]|uniref:type III secretion protein n=1 Tax=Proteus hauseri TaxID=183417 RepID=UPI0032DA9004